MFTTASFRRIAAIAGATIITCISAITTTYAIQPASATTQPQSERERPCFIIQPRWNSAIDGPPPTCPTPSWQSARPSGVDTRSRIEFADEYGSARR